MNQEIDNKLLIKVINGDKKSEKLMIKAIDILSEVADVHVMVVPGNHDRESVMHLGDTLQLFGQNIIKPHKNTGKKTGLLFFLYRLDKRFVFCGFP